MKTQRFSQWFPYLSFASVAIGALLLATPQVFALNDAVMRSPASPAATSTVGTPSAVTPSSSRTNTSAERVLGLVEVPSLLPVSDSDSAGAEATNKPTGAKRSQASAAKSIKVYESPNEQAKVLAEISDESGFETREHGYEEFSAVVYGENSS